MPYTRFDYISNFYWRKYHSAFRITGDGFEGLQAFGRSEKPYRELRLESHRLLQCRFRQMEAEFPQFKVLDRLADERTTRQGRAYDADVFRYSLMLVFLKNHITNALSSQVTKTGFLLLQPREEDAARQYGDSLCSISLARRRPDSRGRALPLAPVLLCIEATLFQTP